MGRFLAEVFGSRRHQWMEFVEANGSLVSVFEG